MANKKFESNCLHTEFAGINVYTFPITIREIIGLYYVAVRGRDSESGAVQRVLNKRRIDSIKQFVLGGNSFFNVFILNWTDNQVEPKATNGKISFPLVANAAQVIDGQHRLAGIEAALEEEPSIADMTILISLAIRLSTKDAAKIFLNINTEQKPVPKSLIYDLFGEVEDNQDHAINRARDIAQELNENIESPFYQLIKYPGTQRKVGVISLSTVVDSLKKHLEPQGVFDTYNLRSLSHQKSVIFNYFSVIRYAYDDEDKWNVKAQNPFLQSAGFFGAVEALTDTILPKCASQTSFTFDTFKNVLGLEHTGLLYREDIRNLDGKTARTRVKEFLEYNILKNLPKQDEYEF